MLVDAITALVEDNLPESIERAFKILADDVNGTRYKFDNLLAICRQVATTDEVSKIVVATFQTHPEHADQWLVALYNNGFSDSRKTLAFELGALLGIFKSLNWLDCYSEHAENLHRFEAELKLRLSSIISKTTEHGALARKYEQELSYEIKKYVDNPYERYHVPYAFDLIESFAPLVKPNGGRKEKWSNENIGAHGKLVMEQLCYAAFGCMAETGRIKIMSQIRPKKILDIDKRFAKKEGKALTASKA